jgi:DNA-binding response OmpR family regulator
MKLLIVEDEHDIASFLKKGLEENGHETHLAFDGEMGLRLAANVPFDVILLDIILPKINGLEVCKNCATNWDIRSQLSCLQLWEQRMILWKV